MPTNWFVLSGDSLIAVFDERADQQGRGRGTRILVPDAALTQVAGPTLAGLDGVVATAPSSAAVFAAPKDSASASTAGTSASIMVLSPARLRPAPSPRPRPRATRP